MHLVAEAIRPTRKLTVRLAESPTDLAAAQSLRWRVFVSEMGAQDTSRGALIDADDYDTLCQHLIVEDHAFQPARLVGTYRLLRQSQASKLRGFYSEGEFAITPILQSFGHNGELLELGRSCVDPEYRDSATIQLLWKGLASYLKTNPITALFGCASFSGTDPDVHAEALSYLHHHTLAPPEYRVAPVPERRIEMARLAMGTYDPRLALRKLPPLIRGYLNLGAMVGDGAVIDHQFNTIDVFILMPVSDIAGRYLERMGKAA